MKEHAHIEYLLDSERWQEAEEVARAALARQPGSGSLHAALALACLGQGRVGEADEASDAAVGCEPMNPYVHMVRAFVLRTAGFLTASKRSLDEAVRLDPGRSTPLLLRAEWNLEELELFPRLSPTTNDRLAGYREKRLEVMADLAEAERLEPHDPHVHVVRGRAFLVGKLPARARASAEEALRLRPDHAAAHEVLARAAEMVGDTKAASHHYVAVGRARPGDTKALVKLRQMGEGSLVVHGIASFVFWRVVFDGWSDTWAMLASGALTWAFVALLARRRRRRLQARLDPEAISVLEADASLRQLRTRVRRRA